MGKGRKIVGNSRKSTDVHFEVNVGKQQASGVTNHPYYSKLTDLQCQGALYRVYLTGTPTLIDPTSRHDILILFAIKVVLPAVCQYECRSVCCTCPRHHTVTKNSTYIGLIPHNNVIYS